MLPIQGILNEVTETETETIVSDRGHFIAFFTDENIFSGINTPDATAPGVYYSKGGTREYVKDKDTGVNDNTKITGDWVNVCAAIKATLESGGNGNVCEGNVRKDCMDDCKWEAGTCIPMPWE